MKKLLFILIAVMSAASISAEQKTPNIGFSTSDYVWRSGTDIYCGDQLMSSKEYKYFLQNTCPRAYKQYKKADRLMKAGWSVFGMGAASFTIGGVMLVADLVAPSHDCGIGAGLFASLVTMPVAGACFLAGIPMLSVGYKDRDRSIATYNIFCKGEPPITYNITAGQNGIGFAVNF